MAKLSQPPSLLPRWQANIGDHVSSVAWSPDGSAIAFASISGPITIFDVASGSIKHTLKGHGFGTCCVAWQPNGKVLASGGQDGKIRFWDTVSGSEIIVVDGGAAWVERIAWSPNGDRLASAAGKRLRLWDQSGDLLLAYAEWPSTITDVAWLPKGKEIVATGYGGVAFFTLTTDMPRAQFAWKGSVLVLAISPDGKYIVGGSQNSSVHFWYAKDGKDLEMSGYPLRVRELSWDSTSTYLATGGGNQITIWNCSGKGPAGSTPISFELHEEPINALAFQHRGPLLASACGEGILALWYPGGSKKVLAQTKITDGLSQIAWSPNDSRLAVGGTTGYAGVFAV